MPYLAALILCATAALVARATPAPQPRPWVTGWDKPVDPKGDCRFEREGERLTITVPGKGHGHRLDWLAGCPSGPRLLRDVAGDFVSEVRVSGNFWHSEGTGGYRGAGFVVMGAKKDAMLTLQLYRPPADLAEDDQEMWLDFIVWHPERHGKVTTGGLACPPQRPIYLRLERRGDMWRVSYSKDHKKWTDLSWDEAARLPRKVKVGMVAEAEAEGTFKAVFDQFKLSRPK